MIAVAAFAAGAIVGVIMFAPLIMQANRDRRTP